jgi:hypothetical protein
MRLSFIVLAFYSSLYVGLGCFANHFRRCAASFRKWTPLTTPAVHAAPGLALYQAGCLQRLLDPGIAQPDLVVLAQHLMEVPHVQIEVPVPVQAQNVIRLLLRHSPGTGLPQSPVQQALVAFRLVARPPSPHLQLADTYQLRCLTPLDLARCGA